MSRVRLALIGLAGMLAASPAAMAQMRPYIGYVYPAGGQQGTTFMVKLGGQGLDDIDGAIVSGQGVTARVVEYQRKFGPQDIQLLVEQLRELKREIKGTPAEQMMNASVAGASSGDAMMMSGNGGGSGGILAAVSGDPRLTRIARIQQRINEYVLRPACASIAALVYVEVKIAPNAPPGTREFAVKTPRGVSNPLVFRVGQLPEHSRKPMVTSQFQVLGKEELALRKRPDDEVEVRITVPCTVNGQIASGEVNRYRFEARKGQRLVLSVDARQLIPYVADAVPGWFQPVLTLYDAEGKEVAYNDDYRFKPDPLILYEVPKDGEYVFAITDAIYRGREDFVYRVTIGELPFVTSIFPLGGREGYLPKVNARGWNLQDARLTLPPSDAPPGVHCVTARKNGMLSNCMPFAVDTLPECIEKEPNNDLARAQPVKMPMIVNGRINRPDDWDVFQVTGRAGDKIVAEVSARRLDSPLDSVLKITDAAGKVLAFNDDFEDLAAGTNTHDADSYLLFTLPTDGKYYIHLGDAARHGGEEYAYRLRISAPRPDFALRTVPSTISMRSRSSAALNVHVIRKDGFAGPIKLGLKDPPLGISCWPATIAPTQTMARLALKTDLAATQGVIAIQVEGQAMLDGQIVSREAVPAEDRMQAFLWRHLVPAQQLKLLVFDPAYDPPPKRVRKVFPPAPAQPEVVSNDSSKKSKFTKQQVAGRLRQLKLLFEDGLTTDEFDHQKVLECEAAQ